LPKISQQNPGAVEVKKETKSWKKEKRGLLEKTY
jgi:hypothetical protein